jgi:hypothetical protein
VLSVLKPEEIENAALLRDALAGYLPPAWVELCVAGKDTWASKLPFDVRALLGDYDRKPELMREVRSYRDRGQTDRLDELVSRLCRLLEGPETGVLIGERQISLSAFEALCGDLPGDSRERLQEALGKNPTATALIDVRPEELLQNYPGSAAQRKLVAWKADASKHHRIGLLVTTLSAHLSQQARLAEVKRSNVVRASLGHVLAELPEKWALELVATLKRLGITPIRPA